MYEVKRILGTSFLSFLLVIWGLFMVCSGRVPDVNYDDEFFEDGEFQDAGLGEDNGNGDLMDQLAVLDEESGNMEDNQRNEILAALGIESEGAELSRKEEEDFLSEELFLDLEVEIAEMEKIAKRRAAVAESLRTEVQETDYRLSALNTVVGDAGTQFTSARSNPTSNFTAFQPTTEYGSFYQDALNDVYAHRYDDAIAKFRRLLQMNDTENLADNCQYWIGESYYAKGKYESAIAEFEKVFAFEKNNKTDDAQFMIGMAYAKLGDAGMASAELKNLMSFYQDSEYVARARREFSDLNI